MGILQHHLPNSYRKMRSSGMRKRPRAFKQLKQVMMFVHVLALLNFSLPSIIEIDTSRVGLEQVLSLLRNIVKNYPHKCK